MRKIVMISFVVSSVLLIWSASQNAVAESAESTAGAGFYGETPEEPERKDDEKSEAGNIQVLPQTGQRNRLWVLQVSGAGVLAGLYLTVSVSRWNRVVCNSNLHK